jgi:hypothetical protein
MKDLFNKNYKSLRKGIKEDLRDGKISHARGLPESIL